MLHLPSSRLAPALLACVLALPALAESPQRTITVTGEGRVSVVPDVALVSVGVSREAPQASDALREMSEAMTAVLARFDSLGIAPSQVQTSQIALGPRFDYRPADGEQVLAGFVASSTVTLRLDDLGLLGEVLDLAVEDGANQLGEFRFLTSDETFHLDAARRAAVADAIDKAGLFAMAGGVTLGPVLSIEETGGGTPFAVQGRIAMAMEAMAVPLAPGEAEIAASVTMVFAIAD